MQGGSRSALSSNGDSSQGTASKLQSVLSKTLLELKDDLRDAKAENLGLRLQVKRLTSQLNKPTLTISPSTPVASQGSGKLFAESSVLGAGAQLDSKRGSQHAELGQGESSETVESLKRQLLLEKQKVSFLVSHHESTRTPDHPSPPLSWVTEQLFAAADSKGDEDNLGKIDDSFLSLSTMMSDTSHALRREVEHFLVLTAERGQITASPSRKLEDFRLQANTSTIINSIVTMLKGIVLEWEDLTALVCDVDRFLMLLQSSGPSEEQVARQSDDPWESTSHQIKDSAATHLLSVILQMTLLPLVALRKEVLGLFLIEATATFEDEFKDQPSGDDEDHVAQTSGSGEKRDGEQEDKDNGCTARVLMQRWLARDRLLSEDQERQYQVIMGRMSGIIRGLCMLEDNLTASRENLLVFGEDEESEWSSRIPHDLRTVSKQFRDLYSTASTGRWRESVRREVNEQLFQAILGFRDNLNQIQVMSTAVKSSPRATTPKRDPSSSDLNKSPSSPRANATSSLRAPQSRTHTPPGRGRTSSLSKYFTVPKIINRFWRDDAIPYLPKSQGIKDFERDVSLGTKRFKSPRKTAKRADTVNSTY